MTRHRIPEIDGLRGVAIALIVIYHIWLHRVSGGVDVFFVLTGFFATAALLGAVERTGRPGLLGYYARTARRILPPALVVLAVVIVASILWLPRTRWREILGDVVASALYWVNWRLADQAVDYLASQYAASPAQHYWSLAVQGQFYLLWPLLFGLIAVLAARLAVRPARLTAGMLTAILVASLGYAVHRTAADQVHAYFDTGARLWEFALGGLLWLAWPWLRPPRRLAILLGWLGLVALLTAGLVFRAGDEFPGWAALWPTLAACALIVTAGTGSRWGADRLLRSWPLRALGDLAYGLYLWHWPVLICYLAITDRVDASARGGLLVIVISTGLTVASQRLFRPRPPARPGRSREQTGFALAAGFLAAVLAMTAGWSGVIVRAEQAEQAVATTRTQVSLGDYPGAAHLVHGGDLTPRRYRPGPLTARDDRAGVLYPDCHQDQDHSEPLRCELGVTSPERTIAVVGGSRAQHWLPALAEAAREHRWRIVAFTKSACLFSADERYLDGVPYTSCNEWNDRVMAELHGLRPDAVFTTSTRVTRSREFTPDGYLERWHELHRWDIEVLAIRDIPRPLRDIPDCVELHWPDVAPCASPAERYQLDRPAAVATHPELPPNVHLLDLSELFCVDGGCPAVIGNVLVYHDASHMSATYARTTAPFLGAAIQDATGWATR